MALASPPRMASPGRPMTVAAGVVPRPIGAVAGAAVVAVAAVAAAAALASTPPQAAHLTPTRRGRGPGCGGQQPEAGTTAGKVLCQTAAAALAGHVCVGSRRWGGPSGCGGEGRCGGPGGVRCRRPVRPRAHARISGRSAPGAWPGRQKRRRRARPRRHTSKHRGLRATDDTGDGCVRSVRTSTSRGAECRWVGIPFTPH